MKLFQFVTKFAVICNKTKLCQFVTQACPTQFVIHIYFCYWVLLLLQKPYGEGDLGWGYLTHQVRRLIDHVITWYANKTSIFAKAQFFSIQGSFLLIYKQKLKSGKVTSLFSKSTNLWKKIFISRHNMIIFIYKSWSVNSGWLILFVRSKVTRGDSFAFKMLITIFSLQEQSF